MSEGGEEAFAHLTGDTEDVSRPSSLKSISVRSEKGLGFDFRKLSQRPTTAS